MPYQKQNNKNTRQLQIIKRLYDLESLEVSKVSSEYHVSARTMTRDMKQISSVIPLINKHGIWTLNVEHLRSVDNVLSFTLLQSFAKNMQMDVNCFELYSRHESKVNFAIEYNHLPKQLGEKIVTALQDEFCCTFDYLKPHERSQRKVDPIKLYTQSGRWYIIARDYKDDTVKTFLLSRIENFKVTNEPISLTTEMLNEAEEMKNVWTSREKQEILVRLYVKPDVLSYIEDIKIHYTQEIVEYHYDGGAEIHCTITHKLEILPTIKSWLPNIHILEPKWLWEELMRDLEFYRDDDDRMDI